MAEDLRALLVQLLGSGDIESAAVTVVLKPKPPPTDPDTPVCHIDFGPVSTKE